ncbi:hypothetical protein GCM10023224_25260 [Streptomonospora halophila]|uniref:Uncharacterized protein n=1 Tax=Streptomonospora halophila TaxID=427369 RepID=A0ABP9GPI1_9ACTN
MELPGPAGQAAAGVYAKRYGIEAPASASGRRPDPSRAARSPCRDPSRTASAAPRGGAPPGRPYCRAAGSRRAACCGTPVRPARPAARLGGMHKRH